MDWLKDLIKGKTKRNKNHTSTVNTSSLPDLGSANLLLLPAQPAERRHSHDAQPISEGPDSTALTTREDVQVTHASDSLAVPSHTPTLLRKKTSNPTPAEAEVSSRQASALRTSKGALKTILRLASTILQADPTQVGKAVVDTISLIVDELEVWSTVHLYQAYSLTLLIETIKQRRDWATIAHQVQKSHYYSRDHVHHRRFRHFNIA